VLDKSSGLCYTIIRKRKEILKMTTIIKIILSLAIMFFVGGVIRILLNEVFLNLSMRSYDKEKAEHVKKMRENIKKGLDN